MRFSLLVLSFFRQCRVVAVYILGLRCRTSTKPVFEALFKRDAF